MHKYYKIILSMSIKKKIILIFSASFAIIAIFGISATFDLLETRKEFNFLKISDSIRSKVLQIRRHEKNYFLYGNLSEIEKIQNYLEETYELIREGKKINAPDRNLIQLELKIKDYSTRFYNITELATVISDAINRLSMNNNKYRFIIPFMRTTFMEHPEKVMTTLKQFHSFDNNSKLNHNLKKIKTQIDGLRKTGEEIINIARELDRGARYRVQSIIKASEVGIRVIFPLSFFFGFITLFLVTQNIVKRLNELMITIKKTGEGYFSPLPFPSGKDEISTLIRTYNNMAEALKEREMQLIKKEEELIQHRKLAAIGILASGVAHELNNPLNNIHLSAQILERETEPDSKLMVKETIEDILSQSLRVKKIVGDLLEFARERKPEMARINLPDLIKNVYSQVEKISSSEDIRFSVISSGEVYISVDPEQMERVLLNLFTNAVDAMSGKGDLIVRVSPDEDVVKIEVSDTGPGIPEDTVNKIFDPFFTTKDRGTGLGLSIVYNIIKNHYGRVEVKSSCGQGTTFTIYLPREI